MTEMTTEHTLQDDKKRKERIEELVKDAMERGATLEEIHALCKSNPVCKQAAKELVE